MKIRALSRCLLVVFLIFFNSCQFQRSLATPPLIGSSPAPAAGRIFYVAPTGNDTNPGTRDRPWRSPAYGVQQLIPGDTLVLLSGRYILADFEADVLRPNSGTAGAWVTIRGEGEPRPVLAGRDNLLTAIDLSGVQYMRLEHLEITHDAQATGEALWFRDGIEVLGVPAAHLVLQDLYIHHVDEFCMNLQDIQDVQILNSRLEYCGFGALGGPVGEAGGWRNVMIRGTSLSWSGHYYQGGDGSTRPYDRPDGLGIEPSVGPVLIEDTRAEHNYGDGLDSKVANTTIRRSIVANNRCDGVKLWGAGSRVENTLIYGRGDGNPELSPWAAVVINPEEQANAQFELVNVTVDDALGRNYVMYVQYDHPNVPTHLTLRNVIFSARGPESPIYLSPATVLTAEHNLFYFPQNDVLITHGEKTYTCADLAAMGTGNFCGDPHLVRVAWGDVGDYHLQGTSPAINAGNAAGAPTEDLEGRLRDAQPDIGAYEYWEPAARLYLPLVLHLK